MNKSNLINIFRIVLDLFLIGILIYSLVYVSNYTEEVKEAIGEKQPDRLLKIYEEETGTNCLCANPQYGYIMYIPNT